MVGKLPRALARGNEEGVGGIRICLSSKSAIRGRGRKQEAPFALSFLAFSPPTDSAFAGKTNSVFPPPLLETARKRAGEFSDQVMNCAVLTAFARTYFEQKTDQSRTSSAPFGRGSKNQKFSLPFFFPSAGGVGGADKKWKGNFWFCFVASFLQKGLVDIF